MQSVQNLVTREDTLLGVCQGLGEDLGFNPIFLRLPFGVLLLWNPTVVIGTYLALGAAVMLARFVAPNPRIPGEPGEANQPAAADSTMAPTAVEGQYPLPIAA
jgi:phage shock protein C